MNPCLAVYILGIDNHLAIAIDVAISSIYQQLHAWTQTINVLIGPFMFWHKWSGGTIYDKISVPAGPIMLNINDTPLCGNRYLFITENY